MSILIMLLIQDQMRKDLLEYSQVSVKEKIDLRCNR